MKDIAKRPIDRPKASPRMVLGQFVVLGIASAFAIACALYWSSLRLYSMYFIAGRPSAGLVMIHYAIAWLALFSFSLRWLLKKGPSVEDSFWLKCASVSPGVIAGGLTGGAVLFFTVPAIAALMVLAVASFTVWTYGETPGKSNGGYSARNNYCDGTVVEFGSFSRNGLTVIYREAEYVIVPPFMEIGLASGAPMLLAAFIFAL